MTGDDIARLAYLGLLGAAIAGWVFAQNRPRLGPTLQMAAIWALIFIGVIAAVGLWTDIRRDVLPRQEMLSDGGVRLPVGPGGHYQVTLDVNGVSIPFIVDTGATDLVLSRDDAARAGIDPETLTYMGTAMTANGPVRTASVWLDSVRLGEVAETDVRATVTEGELDASLLGMSYLGRFARITIENGEMILSR